MMQDSSQSGYSGVSAPSFSSFGSLIVPSGKLVYSKVEVTLPHGAPVENSGSSTSISAGKTNAFFWSECRSNSWHGRSTDRAVGEQVNVQKTG